MKYGNFIARGDKKLTAKERARLADRPRELRRERPATLKKP